MIAYLKGQPLLNGDSLIIICHGVGYGVHVSGRSLSQISATAAGEDVELFVYTHVREEALELFGFMNREEQSLFQLLLDVSGVGPKTALGILNYSPQDIITAVQNAETGFFSKVPRVGKKLAQKIIIELRGKLGALKELDLQPLSAQLQEVKEALLQLGFSESDIDGTLQKLNLEPDTSMSSAIRQALKHLSPS